MTTHMMRMGLLIAFQVTVTVCSAQMYSHYSTYDNITVSADADGLPQVTATVTLEGYTQWSCCYPPAKHTGNVSLNFGGVKSSNTTGQVNPNYNMNLSTSVTLDETDACFSSESGCLLSDDTSTVDCSLSGQFYGGTGSFDNATFALRDSSYLFAGIDPSSGRCTWVPTCTGTCSSPNTTNTVNGQCYSGNNRYRLCFDLLMNGSCWIYRALCVGSPISGACS